MDTSQAEVIKKCRDDLKKERIVKSILCGMAVGFAVCFVVAFVTWIFEFKGLWLSLGLGVAAGVGAAFLFYFFVFTLTDMDVMKRIDRVGLDERMVTMYELRNDNSYIAQRQRANASAAFDAAVKMSGGQLIKMKIATAVICASSIVGALGIGMAIVTGLSDYGVIPTLYELCSDGGGGLGYGYTAPTYTVTYTVGEDGGGLVGNSTEFRQSVKAGGTSSVKIKPDADSEGYMYYLDKLIDDKGNEYFTYTNEFKLPNVRKNMAFTVLFEKEYVGDEGGLPFYYDPNNQQNNNEPGDQKGPSDPNEPPDSPPEGPPEGPSMPSPPSAGSPSADDTIIDGETPYGEEYDFYYGLAMDMLANGTEGYPSELVSMLEGYFGILL